MGMGLNICRSIIESHRGRLWVVNNVESDGHVTGATFHCSLPIGEPDGPSNGGTQAPTPDTNRYGRAMNSPVTTQETVFVVDDDEAVRDSLRWLLEANGYRVQCFSSAEQFIDAWQPHQHPGQIACLILDVRMSGMSGLELQERLIADNASLPIIFVTGHGDVPMAVSTMKKGAMDFIEKPFDEAELRKLVERMLDKARSESTSVQQQRAAAERLGKLTAREHQVLERIIAGRLNKQIADDLGISIKTVEAHRANIMEKLNVNTVADLLRLALSNKPQPAQ